MKQRNLDGIYFDVYRDGKYQSVCFSDLSPEEREAVCRHKTKDFYKRLGFHLADCLKAIGNLYDLEVERK